ncbi:TetR/AcrR family transcriptional regulator [Hoeflea sp.]|nr:TetR/AcrR family transcriptional regulator [Hoeflea sp.]
MDTAQADIARQRVCDILDKVRSVFALNGFDGASMQELAQAAQMSVGNFYRYFSSKDAIVTALVKRDLEEIEAVFATIQTASDPGAMFMQLLRYRIENMPFEEAALWSEVHAAASRSPEIAELMRNMEQTVRSNIVDALVRIHTTDEPGAVEDFGIRAQFVILLMHGFTQRMNCCGESTMNEQTRAVGELLLSTIRDVTFKPPFKPEP